MSNAFFRRGSVWLALTVSLLVFPAAGFAQYSNGIYAEFNTSMGSYTCRLEYVSAPRTVANFISLATGQRSWLDLPSGYVKTNPYYNGTTFHRVIAGFVIQGGSRNGFGTDGPGYQFLDEFTNTLRHDRFGVLSMANSGPDSNGSQFFNTMTPRPDFDDNYSVFGRLYGGSNVVYAINHVPTDGNDKPLVNVNLTNVVIRRIGAAAMAFDVNTQGLPAVNNLHLKMDRAGTGLSLTFSNRLFADNRIYSSTNFHNWSSSSIGIEVSAPAVTNTIFGGAVLSREFLLMAQILYPPSLFVPRDVFGRTVTLNFSGGNGTIVVAFDNFGGGSYTYSLGGSGPVITYSFTQDPYRGRFNPLWLSGFNQMTLHLDYDSATAGTFKGSYGGSPLTGTFTSTP